MHHRWLRELYDWAGEYRTVNISKGTLTFAGAVRVPALMKQFEHGLLREYTPCRFDTLADQASASLPVDRKGQFSLGRGRYRNSGSLKQLWDRALAQANIKCAGPALNRSGTPISIACNAPVPDLAYSDGRQVRSSSP